MKHQEKLVYTFFYLFAVGVIFSFYKIAIASPQVTEPYTIDHEKDYKKAKQ